MMMMMTTITATSTISPIRENQVKMCCFINIRYVTYVEEYVLLRVINLLYKLVCALICMCHM